MKRLIAVLALVVVPLGSAVTPAHADPVGPSIGPVCLTLSPFANLLVLYFTPNGVNEFLLNGKDIGVGNRAVSGNAFLSGSPAQLFLGFTFHARDAAVNSTIGGGTMSLSTLSGPGFARAIDGGNFTFTVAIATCPVGATAGVTQDAPAVAPNSP
jgi:hypothetical protein